MSDNLQHECGVGLICLRKNLKYYENKYGSPYYGYQKLTLLLEKQHNRGQDGAAKATTRPESTGPTRPMESQNEMTS